MVYIGILVTRKYWLNYAQLQVEYCTTFLLNCQEEFEMDLTKLPKDWKIQIKIESCN